ncbi:hypothetical protein LJC60_08650, partial [Ruminococcaceae bacterium OttesenSCG-928-D13]|nr:hypothetical protein [Ruminococcaceae bacterium OttesenSCG-928-D13]
MTKAEWEKVEQALSNFFTTVTLDVDGYKVQLRLARITTYRNALEIFVNGFFKGEWLINDCEERRRFLPRKVKHLYTASQVEKLRKELKVSKKSIEKHNPSFDYYSTHWTSFSALKKHLIA